MKTNMFRRMLILAAFAGAVMAVPDTATLERQVAELLPRSSEERWMQIPWRTDLLGARLEANEAGKPIFMWLMDGDPLGCT